MVDTAIAAEQALAGKRRGLRAVMPFLGPAFIACVAYVDPGNFATNVAAGAQYGYTLGWVVLTASSAESPPANCGTDIPCATPPADG